VVNLASRLVGSAEPGQVVLDAETARRVGEARVLALGTRPVAGYETPVEVFTLP
jgi:class 3 adenylate cyclase